MDREILKVDEGFDKKKSCPIYEDSFEYCNKGVFYYSKGFALRAKMISFVSRSITREAPFLIR